MDPRRGYQPSGPMGGPESMPVKVAELFQTAGVAFHKLSELALGLHANVEDQQDENMRWSDEDLERLNQAMVKFSTELESITDSVQSRTNKQIKTDIKRKVAIGESLNNTPMIGYEYQQEGPSSSKKVVLPPRKMPRPYSGTPGGTPRSQQQPVVSNNQNLYIQANEGYTADVGPPSF